MEILQTTLELMLKEITLIKPVQQILMAVEAVINI